MVFGRVDIREEFELLENGRDATLDALLGELGSGEGHCRAIWDELSSRYLTRVSDRADSRGSSCPAARASAPAPLWTPSRAFPTWSLIWRIVSLGGEEEALLFDIEFKKSNLFFLFMDAGSLNLI